MRVLMIVGLFILLVCNSLMVSAQSYWQDLGGVGALAKPSTTSSAESLDRTFKIQSGRRMSLDLPVWLHALNDNPLGASLVLPLPDGTFAEYHFESSRVMAEELAAKYPNIQTFQGVDTANAVNRGRFDLGDHGFHGLFIHNGRRIYIDPEIKGDTQHYLVYYASDLNNLEPRIQDRVFSQKPDFGLSAKSAVISAKTSTGSQLRTYRMAVSATAEYTEFHGGSGSVGLAAIVTLVNRLNEVFARELAINFQLVANNDAIVFTDANTDPFDNSDDDVETNADVQRTFIGNGNFDIGHVLNTAGGGLAYNGVCDNFYKARGLSGSRNPQGDHFHVDLVAHEIGHQFGASHTFNGTEDGCEGNRDGLSAWEPGSGSSIMAYSGICGSQDFAFSADPFFHGASIEQMVDYVSVGFGAGCENISALANTPPVANGGLDYNVPANTPLQLKGSGSDADNDVLSFSWEEFDLGTASSSSANMVDDGSRPLFRSWPPESTADRYLPRLSNVLQGTTVLGETYATTNRALNFRLSVRDGQGGVAYDDMRITVTNTGEAFAVTEPSTGASWEAGEQKLVRWNVADTNMAPINCGQVDIALSSDAGINFDLILAEGTPNDGEAEVLVPSSSNSAARLKVHCSDNIFFAINSGDIELLPSSTTPPPPTTEPTPNEPSSSSGGGGGGSFSVTGVLVLLSLCFLTACKPMVVAKSEAEVLQQGDPGNFKLESVEEDVQSALAKGDRRLWMMSGRNPTLPGVGLDDFDSAKLECGSRFISGSGDHLDSGDKALMRRQWLAYAKQYNLLMRSHCK